MWHKAFIPSGKPDGTPILSVLAKKSYTIAPGAVTECDEYVPLVENDVFAEPDNPLYSDVVAENDHIPFKPFTDVVVTGKAYAPRGKRAYHLDVGIAVGQLKKTIRVFGERTVESRALRGLQITAPQPFTEMTLGYRRAYGGIARDKKGTLMTFYPNPIGTGFALKGGFEEASQLRVPNIEDPAAPVTTDNLVLDDFEKWPEAPKPASLGWTRRNFYPRYTYAGVLPEYLAAAEKNRDEMAKKYPQLANAPMPKMDFRVYQGASDGLWGGPLKGNEPVRLTYLDPDNPTFDFQLPGETPLITLDTGEGAKQLPAVLQTVFINKEKNLLSLVWRGCVEYGGVETLAQVRKLEFDVAKA